MAYGTLPSRRYNRAWTTQRILNRAPEWTRARRSPTSITQQLSNVLATEIQDTVQSLAHERANFNLASCDLSLPDHTWKVELPSKFEFGETEDADRYPRFNVPTVWGEIDGNNTRITLAEYNNIQTLFYEALPTRIEYAEKSVLWSDVIPPTQVKDFTTVTPAELPIEGPLYITLSDNHIWEEQFKNTIYYSKIHLKGTGLLGEPIEEVVPLRINWTIKTRSSWKTLDEVFIAHLSEEAIISVSSLPFAEEEVLNSREVAIDSNGIEQYQFYQLGSYYWGSTFVGKRFLAGEMDQIRLGLDTKTVNMEIELLDQNGQNITANAFVFKPWTNYVYVTDDNNFYVYDYSLPFPDVEEMRNETGDSRLGILFTDNKWLYIRDDVVNIYTRILDLASIPVSTRWMITYPDGTQYRLGLDGSLWSTAVDGWMVNDNWSDGEWTEQKLEFSGLSQNGTYTIELEAKYIEEDGEFVYRKTKEIIFVPSIMPETQFPLPVDLRSPRKIGLDEEENLWFYNGTSLLKAKLFHDYFMVDYDKKEIWLREQYPLVRVVP